MWVESLDGKGWLSHSHGKGAGVLCGSSRVVWQEEGTDQCLEEQVERVHRPPGLHLRKVTAAVGERGGQRCVNGMDDVCVERGGSFFSPPTYYMRRIPSNRSMDLPAVAPSRRWATAAKRWQASGKKGKVARIGRRKLMTLVFFWGGGCGRGVYGVRERRDRVCVCGGV